MAKRRGQSGGKAQAGAPAAEVQAAPALPALEAKDPAAAPLEQALRARARGDLRQVRALASGVLAGSPSAAAQAQARRLLADSKPDAAALLTGLAVFVTIVFAAWLAILHRH